MVEKDLLERFNSCYSNIALGEAIMKDVKNGKLVPKPLKDLSNEDFLILSYDLGISDNNMAKMFYTTTYAIKNRRLSLGIKRGKQLVRDWFDSERKIVDEREAIYALTGR